MATALSDHIVAKESRIYCSGEHSCTGIPSAINYNASDHNVSDSSPFIRCAGQESCSHVTSMSCRSHGYSDLQTSVDTWSSFGLYNSSILAYPGDNLRIVMYGFLSGYNTVINCSGDDIK